MESVIHTNPSWRWSGGEIFFFTWQHLYEVFANPWFCLICREHIQTSKVVFPLPKTHFLKYFNLCCLTLKQIITSVHSISQFNSKN